MRVSHTQDGLKDYNQEDFEQLGRIRTLLETGLLPDAEKYGADKEVVLIAAWLHDIASITNYSLYDLHHMRR